MNRSLRTGIIVAVTLPPVLLGWLTVTEPAARGGQVKPDLGKEAAAILEKRCTPCHATDATAGFTFLKRDSLLKFALPRNGEPSRILARAVEGKDGVMPPPSDPKSPPPPSEAEKRVLKAWVEAGAPAPAGAAVPGRFVAEKEVLEAIAADLDSAPAFDRKFLRYFTLTNLANAGAGADDLKRHERGLSKLLNSVSWATDIHVPTVVSGAGGTVLRINIRDFAWDQKTWQRLLDSYPYGFTETSQSARHVYGVTDCKLPYIRADWFVANAALPPLYDDLLFGDRLPPDRRSADGLEALLNVRLKANIEQRVAVRSGFRDSGVSRNNRVVERHPSNYGFYWRSYDFRNEEGQANAFKHPVDFKEAGGEIIFTLPNKFQGYMLVDAAGKSLGDKPADTLIVNNLKNPVNQGFAEIRNGLTCMSCHAKGMVEFDARAEQVRAAWKDESGDVAEQALGLYVAAPEMRRWIDKDMASFAKAVLEATGEKVSDREPIVRLAAEFTSNLTVKQAASEVDLTAEAFRQKLATNATLGSLLRDLRSGGSISRGAWEGYVEQVAAQLQHGYLKPEQVVVVPLPKPPPVDHENVRPPVRLGGRTQTLQLAAGVTIEMARIPAGEFLMGDDDLKDNPRHKVFLDEYYMQTTPVTVAQYRAFCAEKRGGQMPPEPVYKSVNFNQNWSLGNHPMVNVTFKDAQEFCAWVAAKTGRRVHLPTEQEWEKAARGVDGKKYSWGNEDPTEANAGRLLWSSLGSEKSRTNPVGQFPANEFGLFDMAGNVWQWCDSLYDGEHDWRVVRGGSWSSFDLPVAFRAAYRYGTNPVYRNFFSGFRCASGP